MRHADKDENVNQFVNTKREFLITETPCFPVTEKINLKKFSEIHA